MPPSQEFRRYRIVVGFVGFGLIVVVVLWCMASVAVSLFSGRRAALVEFSGTATDLAGMQGCQRELEALDEDLGKMVSPTTPVAAPGPVDTTKPSWTDRWRSIGEQCRFAQLRDRGLGPDYDHMAWAHAELGSIHEAYWKLRNGFASQQEARMRGVRRSLDSSREGLSRRTTPAPGT